jgi:hypothetical protein
LANIQHAVLTDPQLHEPKGVSTALDGQIYRSNGAGTGVWTYPSGHAFGELYIDEGVTTQTLPAASAKAKLNPTGEWTTNGSSVVTLSPTNGTITPLQTGEYLVTLWITFLTAAAASGGKYYFHYAVNGTVFPRKTLIAKYSNGVDTLHCSATGFAALAANDVLSIYVGGDATTSSTAITVKEAGFSATLIKPT